jgi:hypothetical protein
MEGLEPEFYVLGRMQWPLLRASRARKMSFFNLRKIVSIVEFFCIQIPTKVASEQCDQMSL